MKATVEYSESRVIVAGNCDQLMIGTDTGVKPNKQAILGDGRRGNVPGQAIQCLPHYRSGRFVAPPELSNLPISVELARRLHIFGYMRKRHFVECSLPCIQCPSKIHNPLPSRPTGQVSAVYPWLENIGVRLTAWVCWQLKPIPRHIPRNIKWAVFGIAHECYICISGQGFCLREIDGPRGKVSVDT